MHRFVTPASVFVLALVVPACDFGRDNGVDSGRNSTIDAATPSPDPDAALDAPGLDAFVAPGEDTGTEPGTDSGVAPGEDGGATPSDTGVALDTGPDAPLVSMPCTAAGACDPFLETSCGAGMACRPGAMGAPTACAMLSSTVRMRGEDCTASSQCVGGTACLDFGDGLRCQELCPMGSIGDCTTGFVCTGSITGADPCIQVCRPLPERCNIYVQDCADPMDACTFASNAETGERYTGCRPAGTRTDGQPCGGTSGSCARGLVCITESGTSSCHYACDPAVMPTSCPAMQACTGTARSWGVGYCRAAM
jgi:hypothetical protein